MTDLPKTNPFISLKNILGDEEFNHITIGELVTAIEENGICTYDIYNRLQRCTVDSEQGQKAMALIRTFRFYDPNYNEDHGIPEYEPSPLDDIPNPSWNGGPCSPETYPSDYNCYGWLKDDLPASLSRVINRIKEKAVANKESNHSTFSEESTHDPLPTDGIARMFPVSLDQNENLKHWSGFAKNAPRNKLHHARTSVGKGRTKSHFDPVKVGDWLVLKGKMTQDKVNRHLANNYPPRNAHLKELGT